MEPLGSKPERLASSSQRQRRQRKRLQSCSDTESSCASARPALRKRSRRAASAGADADAESGLCPHQLCVYVRWYSAAGAVKINRLPLDPIASVDDLRGLFRRLIKDAFGGGASLPDYLTAPDYYKFSPAHQLISLPEDIARTEFRLVATLDGWEYTVCERELPGTPDPERKLLVTLAEFESDAVVVDGREYVAHLLSYPTVCVKRAFLDAAVAALQQQQQEQRPTAARDGADGATPPALPAPSCPLS